MGQKNLKSGNKRTSSEQSPRTATASLATNNSVRSFAVSLAAAGLIVAAAVAVYSNSFKGPFVFDDREAIGENRSIRDLSDLKKSLSPPLFAPAVGGRPLTNLSFAVNYAVDDLDVKGFHITNLVIHILAALVLFGVLRRTLSLPILQKRWGKASTMLALAIALIWTVHPLQTESVTYMAQRAESLVGLFYLLTLYCVIRGASSRSAVLWYVAAVVLCLFGMATKEVMVTAPVVVLLYDRAFLAGSFKKVLNERWALYLAMAATWILLAILVASSGQVSQRAEMNVPGVWPYARSQPGVILYYLRLSFWPDSLCLDYSWPVATSLWEILPQVLIVGALLGVTIWGLIRRNAWAILGAWFFLILSPSSSIVNLNDLAFEHRMYLPLAAVATLVVLGGFELSRFLAIKRGINPKLAAGIGLCALTAVCVCLGVVAFNRNKDYKSEQGLWEDIVKKRPENKRALSNLGALLIEQKQFDRGYELLEKAMEIDPKYADALSNYGEALRRQEKLEDAVSCMTKALESKALVHPEKTFANLSLALRDLKRTDEAIACLREALKMDEMNADAHNYLGLCLGDKGRVAEEIAQYKIALELKPAFFDACRNLAITYYEQNKMPEAMETGDKLMQMAIKENNPAHIASAQEMLNAFRSKLSSEKPAESKGKR
jgi:protein O-mannosyl-transferase